MADNSAWHVVANQYILVKLVNEIMIERVKKTHIVVFFLQDIECSSLCYVVGLLFIYWVGQKVHLGFSVRCYLNELGQPSISFQYICLIPS